MQWPAADDAEIGATLRSGVGFARGEQLLKNQWETAMRDIKHNSATFVASHDHWGIDEIERYTDFQEHTKPLLNSRWKYLNPHVRYQKKIDTGAIGKSQKRFRAKKAKTVGTQKHEYSQLAKKPEGVSLTAKFGIEP